MFLRQSGYTVFEAKNGIDAKAVYDENSKNIDLVITDMIMPGAGGLILTEQIKSIQPDIKVIYMSGYSDEAINRQGDLKTDAFFLQKPLPPPTFLAKVRQVLDQTN